MANRFPLIVDSSGTAAIKELASGDNLDLTGNGIVGAGTVALTNLTVSGAQGSDGQVLTSTGSGVQWENAASGGISDIVSDTSPQLGGNLDVNGQDIVTTSNGAIDLDPNGSGVVTFKGNATRGAGQFKLNCENNSHGIIIKGPPHSAAASYTLTLPNTDGNADQVLKTNGSGVLDWVDSGGGGGSVWNVINDTTISSAASSVAFTSGLSGYRVYKILITDVYFSGHFNAIELQVSSDGGSSYQTTNWQSIMTHTDDTLSGLSQTNDRDTVSGRLPVIRSAHQYNTDQRVFGEITIWNLNNSHWTYVHSRILNNYFSSRLTYTETHAQLRTTTAFNAFKFTNFYGEQNFTGGHITVYGVGD
jgi:hypothetical protein